jgi:hypothetical protein
LGCATAAETSKIRPNFEFAGHAQDSKMRNFNRTRGLTSCRLTEYGLSDDETFAGVFEKNADRVLIFYLEDAV